MKIVFVSGPFRAPTAYQIKRNVDVAEAAALEIWKLGAMAYCPHLNTTHFQGIAPDSVWLDGNLEMLKRACDAVLMCGDWRQSEGAKAEREAAIAAGIPVFESLWELGVWLESGYVRDNTRE